MAGTLLSGNPAQPGILRLCQLPKLRLYLLEETGGCAVSKLPWFAGDQQQARSAVYQLPGNIPDRTGHGDCPETA